MKPLHCLLASAVGPLLAVFMFAPGAAQASPPTAQRFHLGVGFAHGDPFNSEVVPNPWGHGLTFRAGYTFLNGVYVGAMSDLHFGSTSEVDGATVDANTKLFGAVAGVDLKLASTVAARLTAMFGLHNPSTTARAASGVAIADAPAVVTIHSPITDEFFIAPSLEVVLGLGRYLYLSPAVRLNLIPTNSYVNYYVTFSMGVGATL